MAPTTQRTIVLEVTPCATVTGPIILELAMLSLRHGDIVQLLHAYLAPLDLPPGGMPAFELEGEHAISLASLKNGPTFEAFIKPDVVAPGGHMLGLMDSSMQIPRDHEEFKGARNTFG